MRTLAAIALLFSLWAVPSFAQVTAQESITGYLTTSGCANGQTVCFVQYGAGGSANPAAGATGSAVPAAASYTGFNSGGNLVGASSANPFPVTIISGGGSGANIGLFSGTTPTSGAMLGGQDSSASTTFDPLTVNTSDLGLYTHVANFPGFTFTGTQLNVQDTNSASLLTAAQAPLAAQATTTINIGNTGGLGANNAAVVGYPHTVAGIAQNAEATAASNGQTATLATDLVHKLITLPYANPENFVTSTAATIATSPGTSLIPSAGTGLYSYITSLSCYQTGTTATTVVLTNGSGGSVFYNAYLSATAGSGFTISFPTPMGGKSLSTATAVYAYASTGSEVSCNATSYKGS